MPMFQFCFIQLHSNQLHILFLGIKFIIPIFGDTGSFKSSSLEHLRNKNNKKSKYSYAFWERDKRYSLLEEICAVCCIWIQRKMGFS